MVRNLTFKFASSFLHPLDGSCNGLSTWDSPIVEDKLLEKVSANYSGASSLTSFKSPHRTNHSIQKWWTRR